MPAKPSGEVKHRTVHQKQKNGDIYVIERETVYDQKKKYNIVISSKIVSKIPKGTDTPVPTRPKRNSKVMNNPVNASRMKTGMMDIISHLGKESGIDNAVYDSTDTGTAQKILSLARYLLATDGQSFPGITAWQYSHPLPYEDGISEDVYHELFERIGQDENLQQNFFARRAESIGSKAVLAYDSTTISTYASGIPEARHGFNKAHDGMHTIKLLVLYSIETRQPVAFTKEPGNLPDVTAISNALKQLSAIGIENAEIITDNGYYSEHNMAEMLKADFSFITLIKTGIKWVKKEFDRHKSDFESISNACPYDTGIHGITVNHKHSFSVNGESFEKDIYIHLYFNTLKKVEEDSSFERDLMEIREHIQSGKSAEMLSATAHSKAEKYLKVTDNGILFNEEEISEHKKYHGYFALVSDCEKDPFECLKKYRRRETIESYFEAGKQRGDGTRTRVWNTDRLRGRMFVQFVALCYYEYYSEKLRKLKNSLAIANGDPNHDLKGNIQDEEKLKAWIKNTPIYLTLQWFDTVEEVNISSKLKAKRWSTEITKRDRMFLEKIGMNLSSD